MSSAHDIVAIGASAGGIQTLRRLLALLPGDLPAAILIVQHLHRDSPGMLAGLLGAGAALPVAFARDGEPIAHGRVYVAPADCHMLVERNHVRVVTGPKENRHRPAIDPLFRSAAWSYGPRVVGVVLSGTLDDGAAGLWAIRSCGGVSIVQDPADAQYAEMPTSALLTFNVDHCLPLAEIATLLQRLAREQAPAEPSGARERLAREATMAMRERDSDVEEMRMLGKPAGFACPACHGGLWELQDGEMVRYRCHIGHAFGADSLGEAQTEDVETALEAALRALEEQAAASRRLEERLGRSVPAVAARFAKKAAASEARAATIRKILHHAGTD